VMLGDRPPLTPVESFYQRILASDPDEAQDHADVLLENSSLSSYYDEVALKGMQLAARDAERGVLSHQQLERIKETIKTLVEELADYEDRKPNGEEKEKEEIAGTKPDDVGAQSQPSPSLSPPDDGIKPAWRNESAVLCLAGRGPLDEAASAMLAQLLHKHGIGARVLAYRAASREGIANLTFAGVEMVCISYLDISGSPAHLRFLLRRLRGKLPNVKILVGLWPVDDPAVKDASAKAAIGADFYTTSLAGAVSACLAEAGDDMSATPTSAAGRVPSSTGGLITPAA